RSATGVCVRARIPHHRVPARRGRPRDTGDRSAHPAPHPSIPAPSPSSALERGPSSAPPSSAQAPAAMPEQLQASGLPPPCPPVFLPVQAFPISALLPWAPRPLELPLLSELRRASPVQPSPPARPPAFSLRAWPVPASSPRALR